MAAPNTQPDERTCALLIGSGKCYRDEKGTVKKGGIKRSRNKKDVPDGVWAQRDLDNMDRFLKSKGADCVDRFNYEDLDGIDFANGKHDVIKRIEKHFEKEAKYFILYYTGHGDHDGSWVFPVIRKVQLPVQDHGQPESNTRQGTRGEGHRGIAAAVHGQPIQIEAEVHNSMEQVSPSAESVEGSPASEQSSGEDKPSEVEGEDGNKHPAAEESGEGDMVKPKSDIEHISTAESDREKENDHTDRTRAYSDFEILTTEEKLPKATRKNDFITFEEILEIWKEKKRDRGDRYLMIILDCCYAGKWVEKIDSDEHRDRRDICIQAACRSIEICKVTRDQQSSVFTRDFVAAHHLSIVQKIALSVLDHAFVLHISSVLRSDTFSPVSSQYAPFGEIKFFDSYDDMYLTF